MIARTPTPPYFAVIFTAKPSDDDTGRAAMAALMRELTRVEREYGTEPR